MFQQPQTLYNNQYGAPPPSYSTPQSHPSGMNTSRTSFYPSQTASLSRSQESNRDIPNTSPIQTTYVPGFLIASQSGRGPPASVWQGSTTAKEPSPVHEEENPFAKEAPLFRDSRGASGSLRGSGYGSKSILLAKATPRSPGERHSPELIRQSFLEDEDAPPSVSLADTALPGPKRKEAEEPQPTSAPPTSEPAVQPIKLIIFGYPSYLFEKISRQYRDLGEVVTLEEGPQGANWVIVGYRNVVDARRALRKNGEIVEGIYRIGVTLVDSKQAALVGSLTPEPNANDSVAHVSFASSTGSQNLAAAPSALAGSHPPAPVLRSTASNVSLSHASPFKPAPPSQSWMDWAFGPPKAKTTAAIPPPPPQQPAPAPATWPMSYVVSIPQKIGDMLFGW